MTVPTIISRTQWGAKPFNGTVRSLGTPERIVVHHAAGYRASTLVDGMQRLREIQKLHQGPKRNWADIGYHFLIDAAGNVYQGRPYYNDVSLANVPRLAMGAHVLNQNSRKIGVCMLGCFHPLDQGCNDVPTPAATNSLRQLLRFLTRSYDVPASKIATHRDFLPTSCPGDTLFALVDELRTELAEDHA